MVFFILSMKTQETMEVPVAETMAIKAYLDKWAEAPLAQAGPFPKVAFRVALVTLK